MTESARYAYAVTRGLDPADLTGVEGLRGSAVQVVSEGALDAVVADVPLADFSEEALRRNLESLTWLEEVARGHDDVVQRVARLGPTAPMRLATIFHDDEAVRDRLREWQVSIGEVLDRVDGRAEWSVKVVAPAAAEEPAEEPEPTTGAEFLRRRKEQATQRGRRAADESAVAEEVHDTLVQASVAHRVLPAQDPRLTGSTGTMTLNGAYLVPQEHADAFEARVEGLRERFPAVEVQVAGPWPPYSFAVLEQA